MNEVIAVTGPMAAGKNYYCAQLEKEGWSCVDADILVHQAIELVKDKILTKFIPFAEQPTYPISVGGIDNHCYQNKGADDGQYRHSKHLSIQIPPSKNNKEVLLSLRSPERTSFLGSRRTSPRTQFSLLLIQL